MNKSSQINVSENYQNLSGDDIVTPDQLCRILNISRVTEWRWQKKGILKVRGLGGRRFYLLSEVMEGMTPMNLK